MTAVAIEAQVGRVADTLGDEMRGQRAGLGVEDEDMDALALALKHLSGAEQDGLGIGADVDEVLLFHRNELSVS